MEVGELEGGALAWEEAVRDYQADGGGEEEECEEGAWRGWEGELHAGRGGAVV